MGTSCKKVCEQLYLEKTVHFREPTPPRDVKNKKDIAVIHRMPYGSRPRRVLRTAEKTEMIKTLRITNIIVAVLAAVFVVFPAVFGVRSDEQADRFLDSAGSIEEFKEARGDESKDIGNQISLLVREAEAFALYLNPPAKPKRAASARGPTKVSRPSGPVSAKFELLGTSVYSSHPELSLALIDEPGKGLHWVRQGGKVGHLIIEQIKDGLVAVRDGQSTFELVAERTEKRSLVKDASSPPSRAKPALSVSDRSDVPIIHRLRDGRRRSARRPADSARAAEEEAEREKVLAELEAMLMGIESERTDSQRSDEEDAAETGEFISDVKAMRVSAEEAQELDRLGRQLKDVEPASNEVEDDRIESDANLSEPDFNEPDFNELDFNEPDFNEPDFNELDFNEPDFNEPDFNEPDIDEPSA